MESDSAVSRALEFLNALSPSEVEPLSIVAPLAAKPISVVPPLEVESSPSLEASEQKYNEKILLDGKLHGLPDGWEVELRPRTNGKCKGIVDKFYYAPESKKQFRSIKGIEKHFNIKVEKPKPLAIEENQQLEGSTASSSKAAPKMINESTSRLPDQNQ